jgi:hypothetical protein
MTAFDQNRRSDPQRRGEPAAGQAGPGESPQLATPRRAMWSAASLLAIVAMMFAAFYSINAQRTHEGGTSAAVTTPAPKETTGQR